MFSRFGSPSSFSFRDLEFHTDRYTYIDAILDDIDSEMSPAYYFMDSYYKNLIFNLSLT